MASKGQKFKKYTFEFKRMVVDLYINQKWTAKRISKKYGVPPDTISQWAYKLNHGVDIYKNNGLGKNKKYFTKEDLEEQVEILKKFQAFLKAQRDKK